MCEQCDALERGAEIAKEMSQEIDQIMAVVHDSEGDLAALAVTAAATMLMLPFETCLKSALIAAFWLGWKAREGVGDLSAFEEN